MARSRLSDMQTRTTRSIPAIEAERVLDLCYKIPKSQDSSDSMETVKTT